MHTLKLRQALIVQSQQHADQVRDAGQKLPNAIKMMGRNCGLFTEDDFLLNPEGNGGAVVGDSCCPEAVGTRLPASRASSMRPSFSRCLLLSLHLCHTLML